MYEYNFLNLETGEEWTITGCNSREDAVETMRSIFPYSFYEWEYVGRSGYTIS